MNIMMRWAATGFFVLISVLSFGLPAAQASTSASDYSITLVADGAISLPYGGETGAFYAYFTYAAPLPANAERVSLYIDGGNSFSGTDSPINSHEDQYYFSSTTGLSGGTHQLQARYYLATTATWIDSNIITVTVGQANSAMYCAIQNLKTSYAPGQAITVTMAVTPTSGNTPVDWQNGTFTLTFKGPTTVTDANVAATASEAVTVHTPTKPGSYQLTCTFNGSAHFLSSSYQIPVQVSASHATGAIRLYTNPTTVTANHLTTFYVVIPGGQGLPTPTGTFGITIGNASSRPIALTAGGYALVQLTTPVSVSGPIIISYFGDAVYGAETATFPLTNPAVPSTGGSNPTPTATVPTAPTATPKPAPKAGGAGATPGATPTATPHGAAPTPAPTAVAYSGAANGNAGGGAGVGNDTTALSDTWSAVLVAVAFVLVGGAVIASIVLVRRKTAVAPALWQQSPFEWPNSPSDR